MMTLAELECWTAHEILGKYHHRIHPALKRPPIAVWQAALGDTINKARQGGRMHDWTLNSISIDWQSGSVVCRLQGTNAPASLVAHGLRELRLPRKFEWGPSVSVNRLTGPVKHGDGLLRLSIEMQPGDTIEIEASKFELPPPQS